jgi:flagellar biosynthesis/type III secretory pathway protein FliH
LAAQRFDYANDPYFYTPDSYRYSYGGNAYRTNQYGAQILRQAANEGYAEGIRAGRADRQDGWRPDYRNSFAYQDANYGYNGYYVRQADYNYYFRQGFRRGYSDGYDQNYQYGRYDSGNDSGALLQTVLGLILNLQPLGS